MDEKKVGVDQYPLPEKLLGDMTVDEIRDYIHWLRADHFDLKKRLATQEGSGGGDSSLTAQVFQLRAENKGLSVRIGELEGEVTILGLENSNLEERVTGEMESCEILEARAEELSGWWKGAREEVGELHQKNQDLRSFIGFLKILVLLAILLGFAGGVGYSFF